MTCYRRSTIYLVCVTIGATILEVLTRCPS